MTKYIPYILIALIIIVIIQSVFIFNQNSELKGLRQGQELLDKHFEDQKKENTRLIDSLNLATNKKIIETKTATVDSLTKIWNNRPKTPKYDTNIDRINNVDSIKQLFSKYYPNKP